jgi:hypothetical protein
MPSAKMVKINDVIIKSLVAHARQMAKSHQKNELGSRADQRRMDSPFEVHWHRKAERESDGRSRSTRAQWVFLLFRRFDLAGRTC